MNSMAISIIISIATFVLSVATSMFVSGTRWGRVETIMTDLQNDRVRQADITGLRDRLSRIEGMFTLTIAEHTTQGTPNDRSNVPRHRNR